MLLSLYLKNLLRQKSGLDLRLPSDAERLALDIESVTGEHIGTNTLKRLLGFISDEREPRLTTLDILARYLDYPDWPTLYALERNSNSDFSRRADEIRSDGLSVGAEIRLGYLPDRHLLLQHMGKGRFCVVKSENGKLKEHDEIEVAHFVKGYPLIVSHVWRDGADLGSFTAGRTSGLTELMLAEDGDF
ncbi:MAG: hypothetical protein IJ816_03120 [Alloprevotella sp.]|nr:hypothetical protein [Alloprevotella sp.]